MLPCEYCRYQSAQYDTYEKSQWFQYWKSIEIADLLEHNDLPRDESRSKASVALQHAKEDLLSLQEQELALRKLVDQMMERQAKVERAIKDFETVLAPIRSLPSDIMEEICTRMPRIFLSHPDRRASVSNGPWLLGHISRKWRNAVTTSSVLWCKIVIYLDDDPEHEEAHALFKQPNDSDDIQNSLNFYLSEGLVWSGNSPLHIEFNCNDVTRATAAVSAFSVLLPHSIRWKTLILNSHSNILSLISAQNSIEKLETLGVSIRGVSPNEIIRSFGTAYHLQSLDLEITLEKVPISFPWIQLKELDIHTRSISVLLSILDALPRLEYLNCHYLWNRTPEPQIDSAAVQHHVNLRRFVTEYAVFLCHLTLPGLEELSLPSPLGEFSEQDISHFMARSRCSLRALTLDSMILSPTFLQLLQATPSVVSLSLLVDVSRAACKALLRFTRAFERQKESFSAAVNKDIIPALQTLSLNFSTDIFWRYDMDVVSEVVQILFSPRFLTALDDRKESTLRSFFLRLSFYDVAPIEDPTWDRAMETFQKLQGDGLDVKIYGSNDNDLLSHSGAFGAEK